MLYIVRNHKDWIISIEWDETTANKLARKHKGVVEIVTNALTDKAIAVVVGKQLYDAALNYKTERSDKDDK